WLGREMPTWPAPLPIRVTVQMDGAGGATTFVYGPGGVEKQDMHIEGRYDRLLASVLPPEITHTRFAPHHPLPGPRSAHHGRAGPTRAGRCCRRTSRSAIATTRSPAAS